MNRTRDIRRAERQRVITRRLGIIRNAWHGSGAEYFQARSGCLGKFNLKCTCRMCKRPRYDRAKAKEVTP